jgi:hypothetical protein
MLLKRLFIRIVDSEVCGALQISEYFMVRSVTQTACRSSFFHHVSYLTTIEKDGKSYEFCVLYSKWALLDDRQNSDV